MQSRIIIAANVITLLVVGYVALQVTAERRRTDGGRGLSARAVMAQADRLQKNGRYQEASIAYSQVERIAKGPMKEAAAEARLKTDVLSIIASRALPPVLLKKLPSLRDQLVDRPKDGIALATLIDVVALRASQGDDVKQADGLLKPLLNDPEYSVWARWLRAHFYLQSNRAPDAIGDLEIVTKRYPEFADGYAALGGAYRSAENTTGAAVAYGHATALALKRQDHLQRMKYLVESEDYGTILKITATGSTRGLSAQQSLYYRAVAYTGMGNTGEAVQLYKAFLAALPPGIKTDPNQEEARRFLERHPDAAPAAR